MIVKFLLSLSTSTEVVKVVLNCPNYFSNIRKNIFSFEASSHIFTKFYVSEET